MSHPLEQYRLLGRSGLRVSQLSLGTMTFGVEASWGCDQQEAEKVFNRYIDCGGNFIDTANFYASGGSERIVGNLVQGYREQVVIATKYSLSMRRGDPNASGNQRKNMVQSVENSLRRLRSDYLDLLYLHVWDSRTPVEEVLRAFDDLVRSGKVLYVGISDTPAWQASRMQAIAELRGWSPLVALQIPYSLAERTVERELIPMAREMGMGVLPWSPLAGGILSGKYNEEDLKANSDTGGSSLNTRKDINLATGRLCPRSLAIAGEVAAIARELDRKPAQVALAWTLLNPAVTSTIIGVRTLAQLEENLAALDVTFDEDQLTRLDEASHIEPGFPHELIGSPVAHEMFGAVDVQMPSR